jgi:hypothetical protein
MRTRCFTLQDAASQMYDGNALYTRDATVRAAVGSGSSRSSSSNVLLPMHGLRGQPQDIEMDGFIADDTGGKYKQVSILYIMPQYLQQYYVSGVKHSSVYELCLVYRLLQ